MKILFIGDIVGKIGRQGLSKILPEIKQEHSPDLVIANGENLAHGIGVTPRTLTEAAECGVDFFTSGNHVMSKDKAKELLEEKDTNIIRPANYGDDFPGVGYKIFEVSARKIMIVNMLGQAFMKEEVQDPFAKINEILEKVNTDELSAIIVDFHAEATSEKAAFGWHVDGKVSAVVGSHTHVPTADNKILPQGTAFVTDIGMVGALDSIIGDSVEPILNGFVNKVPIRIEIPESGKVSVNSVLIEVDPKTKKATRIERVDKIVEV